MADVLQEMRLAFNPFEPTATGAPLRSPLAPPAKLEREVLELLDAHQDKLGAKVLLVVGEYGSGKTCLLQWFHRTILGPRGVKSFLFHDPGVHFYGLADTLLRTVGRKNIAKFIWELAYSHVKSPDQGNLLGQGFEEYNLSMGKRNSRNRAAEAAVLAGIRNAILQTTITTDDEIANCLARLVTRAATKPYFQYRDYLPRSSTSLVAESQEAPYFGALLRTIAQGEGVEDVAFLIDEFEEIGLQARFTQRAAHDYLATLRRLINLAQDGQTNFRLILAMTPAARDKTFSLDASLRDQLPHTVEINSLDRSEAEGLMVRRLLAARSASVPNRLFPFPRDLLTRPDHPLTPSTYANPRRLVRLCSVAIAHAGPDTRLPFTDRYLKGVAEHLGYVQRPEPQPTETVPALPESKVPLELVTSARCPR